MARHSGGRSGGGAVPQRLILPIRLEIVPETGSTNADLLARLGAGEPAQEGLWLIANRQMAGRGRQGRAWLDGPGNFMGSTAVLLLPQDPEPASLSFVTALALYETVFNHVGAPQSLELKWPNDLLLGGAKLAGILLERSGDIAVVGIGVNLNAEPKLADREAGSLSKVGPAPDRNTFARDLAVNFDKELDRWRQFGLAPIFSRWLAAAHPFGTALRVHAGDGEYVSGTFAGLGADGALLLRLEDGAVRVIHAGDVTIGES
jgi:BirA family transcriptional regulator, biotin operon repressor / biotin---[acetyl-CoA-carboxylase] ligase